METLSTVADLRSAVAATRCVLVPTMGALHEGHLSLMRLGASAASARGCPLVVSVFVNPAQFNDSGDLARYPRPLAQDLAMLRGLGVDLAFTPDETEIYPPGDTAAAPQPAVPAVGRLPGLEDRFRPGHFAGVCRVVSRLFDVCTPLAAVFGEKDWQQSRVVAAMSDEQGRDTEILVGATVREADGLAMSSRNQHLTPEARASAVGIWRGFEAARREASIGAAELVLSEHLRAAGFEIEYATVRDADTLLPPASSDPGGLRIFAAGVLSGVRLLDNTPWPA